MAIEIEYNTSMDCIIITATGIIEYKDLETSGADLINHSDFRTNINQIFDCSHGELNLGTGDMKQIADDFIQIADTLGLDRKLALVVSRDLDFGRMRQYEVFFQSGPGVLIRVFRSLDEAKSWITR